jgi:hypothetical protein
MIKLTMSQRLHDSTLMSASVIIYKHVSGMFQPQLSQEFPINVFMT